MKIKEIYFFFFSSRRRHTRWNCDWSSDVCSSDLDQVTALDCNAVMPVTVAVNASVPPGAMEAGLGEIETAITGVGVTVTVAVPVFDVSATLVAATWYVPATAG